MACSPEQEQQGSITWGFIGLGQIGELLWYSASRSCSNAKPGYPMARKLRENMPKSYALLILDVNDQALIRFIEHFKDAAEGGKADSESMKVEIAKNARDLAERSVSSTFTL